MFKKQKTLNIPSTKYYDTFDFFLIGDTNIGKTCLLNRYCYDFFSSYKKKKRKPEIFKISTVNDNKIIKLQFWDILFTEENIQSNKKIIDKSDGIIFVCTYDNKESLKRVIHWHKLLNSSTDLNKKGIVLFVNKNDLGDEIVVSDDDIRRLSNELNIDYYSMSAKTGKGVKKAFGEFSQRVITKVYNNNQNRYSETMSVGGKNKENCNII